MATTAEATSNPNGGLTNDAASLAAAIAAIESFLAHCEPGCCSGVDAEALVKHFAQIEHLGAAGKTLFARRAADANMARAGGHRDDAEYLATLTGESKGESEGVLRLGKQLEHQPGVKDAFAKGTLSRARARTVAGAVAVNPDAEAELVRVAQGPDTLPQLQDRARHARSKARSKRQADEHYQAIRRSRSVRTWTDDEGVFRLSGRFTPDAGASLAASLRAETDRVFERARQAGIYESREAYAADALVALITGKGIIGSKGARTKRAKGTESGDTGPDDTESGDTESDAADGSGSCDGTPDDANSDTPPSTRTPDPKAIVRLTIDLAALGSNDDEAGQMAEIPGVGLVPISVVRELLGDAVYDLVITNGVDVAAVCHLGRSIPVSLQRALDTRDPCCVVPGCGRTLGLEKDHYVTDYAKGGPATMANLARICSHHHRLRTHKGFQLLGGPGAWRWVPPGQADPGPPGEPDPPAEPGGHDPPGEPECIEVPLFADQE